MVYDGITADTLYLAALNRFENSKTFYEEHKQELKDGFTVPMRQIAAALSGQMLEVDDMMVTDPVRMVSRLRRDNRYTRDKSLYRDHLWIMFMRNKHEWLNYPCMWFEVNQDSWGCGVGLYYADARYMEIYRRRLIEEPETFLKAVRSAESAGAGLFGESYKKPKPGDPSPELAAYYNLKSFGFYRRSTDFKALENEALPEELKPIYKKFAPMYLFLKSAADERTML
ncbi:MAG: DUF2461 domain-containing protein [Clostridia bacterium]|nr:DUF2461 domain-containing protein [Clostridia bacterium]